MPFNELLGKARRAAGGAAERGLEAIAHTKDQVDCAARVPSYRDVLRVAFLLQVDHRGERAAAGKGRDKQAIPKEATTPYGRSKTTQSIGSLNGFHPGGGNKV